ncbi:MAG: DEAD/DEAH box helicase [Candidatus Aenigmarchaeota archaeon]|nr:DEAD/DEAH box helicase [Candidatus Aenigmarchaeota archaeon]
MVWKLFSDKLQALIKTRGFDRPTAIQTQGIPPIIKGRNTLLIAPTGVGKTESALLPVFDEFVRNKGKQKPISILYVTPLKSLNRDLLRRIEWWAEQLDFEVSVRHGDTSQYERSMQAANPSDMFITTPETLQAMLVGSRMREHMKNVRWIVIDEIHELVDNKRGVQLSVALERLKEIVNDKEKIQIVGLSATVGTPESVAAFLTAGKPCDIVNMSEKRNVEIRVESPRHDKRDDEISEKVLVGPETTARLRRIAELIEKNRSVLTFTNTREFSEVLSSRLRMMNPSLPIETHHSSLAKDVRIDAEERFKQEKLKSLVCTSSLELGIDIGAISLVLQYMSPRQVSKLLQRVGRSGHKVSEISKGIVISTDADDCFEASAIAKLGMERKIEPTFVYGKSLDVLGHQIVGLSLEEYNIPFDKAYSIIKRAYPFRDLAKEEFFETAKLMEKLGYIWVGSKFDEYVPLRRRKPAWLYYYQNMSTIPDVKKYKVIDIVTNKPVGTLDEEFVALHGRYGTSFVVKGQAWRIIDVGENSILVEPEENAAAAIPAWEGELIPVPYAVSQEVNMLRKKIADMLAKGKSKDKIISRITADYPVNGDVASKMLKTMEKQMKYGFVPDHENMLVEYYDDFVVFHAPFGSLINETLGRVLTVLLTNKLGSVGLETDPYRIIVKLPGYQYQQVLDTFREMKPEEMRGILEITLPRSELFEWRFVQVAQRFGMIGRNADFGKAYVQKIIDVYFKQPPYLEALNEIFQEKLDVEGAKKALNDIRSGKIKITFRAGLSELGQTGLEKRYEIVAPDRPDGEILKAFERRLLDTKIGLVCVNCGEMVSTSSVENIPEKIRCKKCGAILVGYVPHRYVHEGQKIIKKQLKGSSLANDEEKHYNMIHDSASLIVAHGRDATLALAGRGIGAQTAARILRKGRKGNELLNEILQAEKQFAKTKKFWKR